VGGSLARISYEPLLAGFNDGRLSSDGHGERAPIGTVLVSGTGVEPGASGERQGGSDAVAKVPAVWGGRAGATSMGGLV